MNVHGEVELVSNDLLVLPSKLVGTIDALGVPVCPVQAVFKHCDGKGMWESWRQSKKTLVQTWPAMAPEPRPGSYIDLTLCQGSWGQDWGRKREMKENIKDLTLANDGLAVTPI